MIERRPPRRSAPGYRQEFGAAGEEAAARWYLAEGYRVIDRNWRCPEGELDLVLLRDRTVVFCEVKARSSGLYGTPFEAVTAAKQQRLRRLAARYLREHRLHPAAVRFDVAGISGDTIEVLEAAF